MKLSEKIQEALREQQEINLSDPAVQKRLAAQWGYVPAGAQPAPSISTAGDGRALSDRAKRLVRLIAGTHRGNIETHRELYALIDSMAVAVDSPPSEPAPSVPEGWQLVPTAESRHPGIYKMLGALHAADNTPGMSEWESYRAMLSEAPEAKP